MLHPGSGINVGKTMITCKQITEGASEHLEGKTSLWQRLNYRMHLLLCVHCRRYFKQFRLTISTLQSKPEDNPPSSAEIDEIVNRIKSEK